MPNNQSPPLNLVNIERASLTVPYASLGDEISRLSADGWSDFKTDRRGDQVTITAEREAPAVPTVTTRGRPIPPPTSLAAKLRAAREAAGLTGKQVAKSAMLTPTLVSDIENGRREPDHWTIWRFALAVGANPATFDRVLAPVPPENIAMELDEAKKRQAEKASKRKGKPGRQPK